MIFKKWFPDTSFNNSELAFCNNANSAIRKSIWKNYKFNEVLTGLEDMDWAKHVISKNYQIYYQADATVHHIHDETVTQIYNRYYREALAYKEIYPREYFGLRSFIKFFIINTFHDFISAKKEKKLIKNLYWIPLFRFLQFFSTYRAHKFKIPMNKKMQQRIFYPETPEVLFSSPHNLNSFDTAPNTSTNIQIFDISRTLTYEMPTWPGSQKFKMSKQSDLIKDGHNDSNISMNIHCGTHLDAPSHFVKNGKTIDELPLHDFICDCIVIDLSNINSNKITEKYLKQISITEKNVLLKTSNSSNQTIEFNKNFVALTTNAAAYLKSLDIKLVGIDGPSVQLFDDESNETHEVLLGNNVRILEGLDLKAVSSGKYKLICLPLKIKGAEGAPTRAILVKGSI